MQIDQFSPTRLLRSGLTVLSCVFAMAWMTAASAQERSEVVMLTCELQAEGSVVTQYEASRSGERSSYDATKPSTGSKAESSTYDRTSSKKLMSDKSDSGTSIKGSRCTDALANLVDGGFRFREVELERALTFIGIRETLQEGELKLTSIPPSPGKCGCDSALPVGGHTCNYCFVWWPPGTSTSSGGSCICNYTPD